MSCLGAGLAALSIGGAWCCLPCGVTLKGCCQCWRDYQHSAELSLTSLYTGACPAPPFALLESRQFYSRTFGSGIVKLDDTLSSVHPTAATACACTVCKIECQWRALPAARWTDSIAASQQCIVPCLCLNCVPFQMICCAWAVKQLASSSLPFRTPQGSRTAIPGTVPTQRLH